MAILAASENANRQPRTRSAPARVEVRPHAFSVQSNIRRLSTQGGASCARFPWAFLPGTFGAIRRRLRCIRHA